MYQIVQPGTISMGFGALSSLAGIAGQLDPKRILIVTGPHVQGLGILDRILDAMGAYRGCVETFINPTPEPEVGIVEACAARVMEGGHDLIIGVGGGSPMDVAKGAAVVAVHGGEMRPLLGRNLLRRKGVPAILIPTTAGSATEVTRAVVVRVPEEGTKKSMWDPRSMAHAAIVDPDLTMQMPPRLTAETGLDALVHAIEGHTSREANALTRMYTWEAMRLIGRYLLRAYRDGSDREAREAMARAATLAGIGMTNSGLGAIHALALVFDEMGFTHCQSLAVLAPWVIRFNARGHEALYAGVAEALGQDVEGLTPERGSQKASESILRLLEDVAISPCLKYYGIMESDLDSLALQAHRFGQRLLPMNVREVTEGDAVALFRQAYEG
jgi:alcohol dehydrogenase